MSFKVIKGTFHIVGYSPDGDSIRFKADNDMLWGTLSGQVKLNHQQHAQLRLEAIDTLETHYHKQHQPLPFAKAATNRLFALLGIEHVVWDNDHAEVQKADDGVPGYILARKTDRYGRPIAFVFAGDNLFDDGQTLYLNDAVAKASVNFQMLQDGVAYPTFYDGLFYDLRALFATTVVQGRAQKLGIWEEDETNQFTSIQSIDDLSERILLLPKLFRRLVDFMNQNGEFEAHQFVDWVKQKQSPVLILSQLHFTHLDNLIEIDEKGAIRLSQPPENLVFLS